MVRSELVVISRSRICERRQNLGLRNGKGTRTLRATRASCSLSSLAFLSSSKANQIARSAPPPSPTSPPASSLSFPLPRNPAADGALTCAREASSCDETTDDIDDEEVTDMDLVCRLAVVLVVDGGLVFFR